MLCTCIYGGIFFDLYNAKSAILHTDLLARGITADGLVAAAPGPLACPSRGARPPSLSYSRSARPRNCLNLT